MASANSSNSSSEGVILEPLANKQISPAIRWTFVLNNWTEEELEYFRSIVPAYCRYCVCGAEIGGEEGTPHLQGYLEFKTKKRPMSVFATKRIHWEKAKGNKKSNQIYCSKENNIKIEHPKPIVVDTISPDMLKGWQTQVLEELKDKPDDRTIHWLWSEEGGVGKTTFLKYLVVNEEFLVLGGKAADCRNGIVEYTKTHDGATPMRIGINIPRSFERQPSMYEAFENIKDMLFYSGKYEGSMVCGNCPHLYIFANFRPEEDFLSEDRWKIKQIW